jgi:hypothetical protein
MEHWNGGRMEMMLRVKRKKSYRLQVKKIRGIWVRLD